MNEIEAKARQLAQVKTAPAGSYDVCRYAIALEMADWMKERMIDKTCKFLDDRIGIDQKIEVNENGEPLADSYIAYCVARKQEAARIINLFKQYMERE